MGIKSMVRAGGVNLSGTQQVTVTATEEDMEEAEEVTGEVQMKEVRG